MFYKSHVLVFNNDNIIYNMAPETKLISGYPKKDINQLQFTLMYY